VKSSADPRLPLILGGVVAGLFNGTFAYLIADLFPTRIRFTGVALVLNIGMTVFSGAAPLVATSLIRATGELYAPGWFLASAAALGLVASLLVKRYDGQILGDAHSAAAAVSQSVLEMNEQSVRASRASAR
jgi:hypothetical protein